MNDEKHEEEKSSEPASARKAGGPAETGRGICTCGHRASNHVAFKYGCQAPGKRKGYCPCMRFIPRNEIAGVPGAAEGTQES